MRLREKDLPGAQSLMFAFVFSFILIFSCHRSADSCNVLNYHSLFNLNLIDGQSYHNTTNIKADVLEVPMSKQELVPVDLCKCAGIMYGRKTSHKKCITYSWSDP